MLVCVVACFSVCFNISWERLNTFFQNSSYMDFWDIVEVVGIIKNTQTCWLFYSNFCWFFMSHFLLLWWSLHTKNQSMVLSAGSPFGVSWDSCAFLYFLITIQYFFFSVLQWWSLHVKRFFMLFTSLLGPITLEYIPNLLGNFRVLLDPFLFNIFSLYYLQLLLVLGQP